MENLVNPSISMLENARVIFDENAGYILKMVCNQGLERMQRKANVAK
jgi:hypothetical protein